MSNFVALRIKKLKQAQVVLAKNHNQRLEINNNNDIYDKTKSINNKNLFGEGNIDDLVNERISSLGVKTVNKGQNESIVAVEMVISATPTAFRNDPLKYGEYDKTKTDLWAKLNLEFLHKKYGDNLIRVDLHLDEATPHLHAIITPIEVKERSRRRTKAQIKAGEQAQTYKANVLNAKHMFNRESLIELQTEAAEAVKDLGIERGIHGSRSKHTTVSKFMSKINEILTAKENIKVPDLVKLMVQPRKYKTISAKEHRNNETKRITKHFKESINNIYSELLEYKKQSLLYKSKYDHEKQRTDILVSTSKGTENITKLLEDNINQISLLEESLVTLASEKKIIDQQLLELEASRKTHMRRAADANSLVKDLKSDLEGAKSAAERMANRVGEVEHDNRILQSKVDFKFKLRPCDRKGPQYDSKGNDYNP